MVTGWGSGLLGWKPPEARRLARSWPDCGWIFLRWGEPWPACVKMDFFGIDLGWIVGTEWEVDLYSWMTELYLSSGPPEESDVLWDECILAGVQGLRLHTGILGLTGAWSKELERWTTALLLVDSFRLNVEAERGIWGAQQKEDTWRTGWDMKGAATISKREISENHSSPTKHFSCKIYIFKEFWIYSLIVIFCIFQIVELVSSQTSATLQNFSPFMNSFRAGASWNQVLRYSR